MQVRDGWHPKNFTLSVSEVSMLDNRYIYCSWNVCKIINISGVGKQIFVWQGDGAELMFNGDQNPNETGHWFAFRESHLAEFGWVTEEGRLLQFKAEIYVWPDNPDSLDSSSQHDLYQSSEILLWAHRAEGTSPSHNSKLHTTHFLSS